MTGHDLDILATIGVAMLVVCHTACLCALLRRVRGVEGELRQLREENERGY